MLDVLITLFVVLAGVSSFARGATVINNCSSYPDHSVVITQTAAGDGQLPITVSTLTNCTVVLEGFIVDVVNQSSVVMFTSDQLSNVTIIIRNSQLTLRPTLNNVSHVISLSGNFNSSTSMQTVALLLQNTTVDHDVVSTAKGAMHVVHFTSTASAQAAITQFRLSFQECTIFLPGVNDTLFYSSNISFLGTTINSIYLYSIIVSSGSEHPLIQIGDLRPPQAISLLPMDTFEYEVQYSTININSRAPSLLQVSDAMAISSLDITLAHSVITLRWEVNDVTAATGVGASMSLFSIQQSSLLECDSNLTACVPQAVLVPGIVKLTFGNSKINVTSPFSDRSASSNVFGSVLEVIHSPPPSSWSSSSSSSSNAFSSMLTEPIDAVLVYISACDIATVTTALLLFQGPSVRRLSSYFSGSNVSDSFGTVANRSGMVVCDGCRNTTLSVIFSGSLRRFGSAVRPFVSVANQVGGAPVISLMILSSTLLSSSLTTLPSQGMLLNIDGAGGAANGNLLLPSISMTVLFQDSIASLGTLFSTSVDMLVVLNYCSLNASSSITVQGTTFDGNAVLSAPMFLRVIMATNVSFLATGAPTTIVWRNNIVTGGFATLFQCTRLVGVLLHARDVIGSLRMLTLTIESNSASPMQIADVRMQAGNTGLVVNVSASMTASTVAAPLLLDCPALFPDIFTVTHSGQLIAHNVSLTIKGCDIIFSQALLRLEGGFNSTIDSPSMIIANSVLRMASSGSVAASFNVDNISSPSASRISGLIITCTSVTVLVITGTQLTSYDQPMITVAASTIDSPVLSFNAVTATVGTIANLTSGWLYCASAQDGGTIRNATIQSLGSTFSFSGLVQPLFSVGDSNHRSAEISGLLLTFLFSNIQITGGCVTMGGIFNASEARHNELSVTGCSLWAKSLVVDDSYTQLFLVQLGGTLASNRLTLASVTMNLFSNATADHSTIFDVGVNVLRISGEEPTTTLLTLLPPSAIIDGLMCVLNNISGSTNGGSLVLIHDVHNASAVAVSLSKVNLRENGTFGYDGWVKLFSSAANFATWFDTSISIADSKVHLSSASSSCRNPMVNFYRVVADNISVLISNVVSISSLDFSYTNIGAYVFIYQVTLAGSNILVRDSVMDRLVTNYEIVGLSSNISDTIVSLLNNTVVLQAPSSTTSAIRHQFVGTVLSNVTFFQDGNGTVNVVTASTNTPVGCADYVFIHLKDCTTRNGSSIAVRGNTTSGGLPALSISSSGSSNGYIIQDLSFEVFDVSPASNCSGVNLLVELPLPSLLRPLVLLTTLGATPAVSSFAFLGRRFLQWWPSMTTLYLHYSTTTTPVLPVCNDGCSFELTDSVLHQPGVQAWNTIDVYPFFFDSSSAFSGHAVFITLHGVTFASLDSPDAVVTPASLQTSAPIAVGIGTADRLAWSLDLLECSGVVRGQRAALVTANGTVELGSAAVTMSNSTISFNSGNMFSWNDGPKNNLTVVPTTISFNIYVADNVINLTDWTGPMFLLPPLASSASEVVLKNTVVQCYFSDSPITPVFINPALTLFFSVTSIVRASILIESITLITSAGNTRIPGIWSFIQFGLNVAPFANASISFRAIRVQPLSPGNTSAQLSVQLLFVRVSTQGLTIGIEDVAFRDMNVAELLVFIPIAAGSSHSRLNITATSLVFTNILSQAAPVSIAQFRGIPSVFGVPAQLINVADSFVKIVSIRYELLQDSSGLNPNVTSTTAYSVLTTTVSSFRNFQFSWEGASGSSNNCNIWTAMSAVNAVTLQNVTVNLNSSAPDSVGVTNAGVNNVIPLIAVGGPLATIINASFTLPMHMSTGASCGLTHCRV